MRVVAAIILDGGEILACRRASHKSLAGKWEFPGGKVESGETDEMALAREIEEELGAQIVVGELVEVSHSVGGATEIEMCSYFAELQGDRPTSSSDHDQLIWLKIDGLKSLDWAELDVPVITALLKL